MKLPIDTVPGTSPPQFVWQQIVETPEGRKSIENRGPLPPSAEGAVAELITVTKRLLRENAVLQGAQDSKRR